jgi:hypothetical protein
MGWRVMAAISSVEAEDLDNVLDGIVLCLRHEPMAGDRTA